VLLDIGYFGNCFLFKAQIPLSLRPSINETKLPEEARQGFPADRERLKGVIKSI
jgi:hypothetical protein